MIALGEKFLHTAHEVKTARKAFARLLFFFDNERQFPELHDLVQDIRRTNGQEAIFLTNGGSVEFIARSKGSGRGFTVDVLVCDEAQELSDDVLAALQPTISAAPLGNPQLILTGTPPTPAMNGEVFTRMRQAGVKGTDRRLCWHEWSSPNLDVWEANPALGTRLSLDAVEDERATQDAETFARERCGVWDENGATGAPIATQLWEDLNDAAATTLLMQSVAAFAIEVSLDRTASIGAASVMHGDRIAVEMVDRQRGTSWVVAAAVNLDKANPGCPFVIDGGGPAASLVPALEAAGVTVIVAATHDVGVAFALFLDAVKAVPAELVHGPQLELAAAVAGAKTRPMGDGPVTFGRKVSTADITPLVAVMLAHWASRTVLKRAPEVWSISEMIAQIKAEREGTAAETGATPPQTGVIERADGSFFTPL